jgi:RecJ-like exonuclease
MPYCGKPIEPCPDCRPDAKGRGDEDCDTCYGSGRVITCDDGSREAVPDAAIVLSSGLKLNLFIGSLEPDWHQHGVD